MSAFVYVGLLRKIVKLCTMEVQFESTENWTIFWNLFNPLLSEYRIEPVMFNLIGWYVDEAGGISKALKVA